MVNPWHATLVMDAFLTLGVALHFAAAPFLASLVLVFLLNPSGYDTGYLAVLGLGASAITAAVCRHPEAAPPREFWATGPLLFFAPCLLWLARVNAVAALLWHGMNVAVFTGNPRGRRFTYLREGVVWTLAALLATQHPQSGLDVQWLFLAHAVTWTAFAHFVFSTGPGPSVANNAAQ